MSAMTNDDKLKMREKLLAAKAALTEAGETAFELEQYRPTAMIAEMLEGIQSLLEDTEEKQSPPPPEKSEEQKPKEPEVIPDAPDSGEEKDEGEEYKPERVELPSEDEEDEQPYQERSPSENLTTPVSYSPGGYNDLNDFERGMLFSRNKIAAISSWRERTGQGLKEAVELCKAFMTQHGIEW